MNAKRSVFQLFSAPILRTFQRRAASSTSTSAASGQDLNLAVAMGNPKFHTASSSELLKSFKKSAIPSSKDLMYFAVGWGISAFIMYRISATRNAQIKSNHEIRHDLEEKLHHEEEERAAHHLHK